MRSATKALLVTIALGVAPAAFAQAPNTFPGGAPDPAHRGQIVPHPNMAPPNQARPMPPQGQWTPRPQPAPQAPAPRGAPGQRWGGGAPGPQPGWGGGPRPRPGWDGDRWRREPGWGGPPIVVAPAYPYPGYSDDYGQTCVTRYMTCDLWRAAPVDTRCYCRTPGGRRLRGHVE
ncbi:MAG: hypothetical protein KGL46_00860 [Hyphomicrobiales bacterium]|nr:hypothetical protein [Hyphomicrobiales bacterium]